MVSWEVETRVREALRTANVPSDCPPNRLFVMLELRGQVIHWAHTFPDFLSPRCSMNCFQGSGKILGASYLKGSGRLASCSVCSQNKSSSAPPSGLLQPLPVWQCLWLDISLDFVTGLPPSDGNTVILTVVGRFSKMLKFIALPKLCFSKETEEMVHSNIF